MLSIGSQQLIAMIMSFIWPLTRILGLLAIAPPFGTNTIPLQMKVLFGIVIASIVAPTLEAPPVTDPLSLSGMMILAQQLVIGLGMGFIMRIAFAGIEMAGEVAGLTMGLGFASFFDPQTEGRSSAITQFLVLIATLLFFAFDIHHALITALIDSFKTIPLSISVRDGFDIHKLVIWGEQIFISGMRISLPIVAALLVTNVSMGILTRAAPQLNLFGIGFPITIGVGFLMLGMILPYLELPLSNLFRQSLEAMQSLSITVATPPGR